MWRLFFQLENEYWYITIGNRRYYLCNFEGCEGGEGLQWSKGRLNDHRREKHKCPPIPNDKRGKGATAAALHRPPRPKPPHPIVVSRRHKRDTSDLAQCHKVYLNSLKGSARMLNGKKKYEDVSDVLKKMVDERFAEYLAKSKAQREEEAQPEASTNEGQNEEGTPASVGLVIHH